MKTQNLITSTVTAFVAASSLSASAIAGTIRHDRSDARYRNFANEDQFASVGRLQIKFANNMVSNCSGTLISPKWVLTAAHCLEYGQYSLTNASFIIGGSRVSINVDRSVKHKDWLRSNRDPHAGVDLGLFRLKTPLGNINPATLYSRRDEDLQVGSYVGFGDTGNGLTGANIISFRTKRAGQNIIGLGSQFGVSNQVLVSDFDDPRSVNSSDPSTRPLNLEYQIAGGDSGGALFIGGLLAGVISFFANTDGVSDADYGDFSATTRVSSHRNWIQNVISGLSRTGVANSLPRTSSNFGATTLPKVILDESEVIGDLSEPLEIVEDTWDNEPVPEPTTVVGGLLSLGGFILARRRRKLAQKQG